MGLPAYADHPLAGADGICARALPDWSPCGLALTPAVAGWRRDPRRQSSHPWGLQVRFQPHGVLS
eukprot:6992600-Alexandrium_andersonii.AAC.1